MGTSMAQDAVPKIPNKSAKTDKSTFRHKFSVNQISADADQIFAKLFLNGRQYFCHIDSGSPISLFPKALLTDKQKLSLKESNILLKAYNKGSISNLGSLDLDLTFEASDHENKVVTIPNQKFLVTATSMTPIIGLDILFAGNESIFNIDKAKSSALIGGKNVQIYDSIEPKAKILSKVTICTKEKQPVFSSDSITIGPNSEAVIPGYIKCLPTSRNFIIEPQLMFGKLVIQGALYEKGQFCNFPVKMMNYTGESITVKKGGRISRCISFNLPENIKEKCVHSLSNNSNRVELIMEKLNMGKMHDNSRKYVRSIIERYHERFLLEDELPGPAKLEHFDVHMKGDAPMASQSYRTAYALRPKLKEIIDRNVRDGLMGRTSSAWNSPTLLVKKPNGKFRLVCDFRKVNEYILPDNYPLPKIDDLLVHLHGSKYFVQMDMAQGYYQVPLTGRAAEVLTVGNEFGQFAFSRMPMGVKSAPSHFQRQMDTVLENISQTEVVNFMDDVLSHDSESELACLKKWENLLKRLEEVDLKVSAAKTYILMDTVKFCGHNIRNGKLTISTDKIEAVNQIRPPTSKKEAQSLYGFFNWLRNYIENFAKISKPITSTFKTYHFRWNENAQKAFETLKALVISNTLELAIPDINSDHFVVETDASDTGMAGALYVCKKRECKVHDNACLQPVQFFSQNFNESQCKKYIREKELMAFRASLAKFRVFLYGRRFVWWTDNRSLKWANALKTSKDGIARILAEIGGFDFEIQIKRSDELKVTDFMSRMVNIASIKMSALDLGTLQKKDRILGKIYNFVKINRWPNNPESKEMQFYKGHRAFLGFDKEGCLKYKKGDLERLIVPEVMKLEMLNGYHDKAGHPGTDNTVHTLGSYFMWYDMHSDVREYVKSCYTCQQQKPNLRPMRPPAVMTDTPSGPFEKYSCDLTGPLPTTDRNNKYIFVLNDLFSKKIYAKPIESKHAWVVEEAFREIVCNNPCLPKVVLTDHGSEFQGEFDIFLRAKKIKHVRSCPYRPQTNGVTERSNQTIKMRLQPYKNPTDWDILLPEIVQQINLCPNEYTRYSPFEVETGIKGNNPHNPINVENLKSDHQLSDIRERVIERQNFDKKRRTEKFQNLQFIPYKIRDKVWFKSHNNKERFAGPGFIIKVYANGSSYMIEKEDGSTYVRRCEELKHCHDRQGVVEQDDGGENDCHSDSDSDDDLMFFMSQTNSKNNRSMQKSQRQAVSPQHVGVEILPPLPHTPVPNMPLPTVPLPQSPQEEQVENDFLPPGVDLPNYTDLKNLDSSTIESEGTPMQTTEPQLANPDSANSSGSSVIGGNLVNSSDTSSTDISEITDDGPIVDSDEFRAGNRSWMEMSVDEPDGLEVAGMLSRDTLKHHIVHDIYTQTDVLAKFSGKSKLRDVIRTYSIPIRKDSDRNNMTYILLYLKAHFKDLPVKEHEGEIWPVVTVEEHYHVDQTRPKREDLGHGIFGWCIDTLSYRQLLMFAYHRNILIPFSCINNYYLLYQRIRSAILNMDTITVQYIGQLMYIIDI